MTNPSTQNLDKILERVKKMVALADHPNTPPHEADLARTQADALMLKYRIDETVLIMSGMHGDSEGGMKPVWRDLSLAKTSSEFYKYYSRLAGACMRHVGAEGVLDHQDGNLIFKAVGFESDLRYMDILLTSCLVEFGKRLEPKYDRNLSDQENAYEMRHAGMERKRIAEILFGSWETENEMKAKNRKVTSLIKKEAEKRGEDPSIVLGRGNNMKTYRESYAEGFVGQIYARLLRMRTANGEDSRALVLADRHDLVLEALYERYDYLRPKPVDPNAPRQKVRIAKGKDRSFNGRAYQRGQSAALMVDLGSNATGKGRMSSTDSSRALG